MTKRLVPATLITAVLVSGCVIHDIRDTCEVSTDPLLYDFDASELLLYVVSPNTLVPESPIVNFYDANNQSALNVTVVSTQGNDDLPSAEMSLACKAGASRAYALQIDRDAWASYAATRKTERKFNIGVGTPGLKRRVRPDSFGFAFVDASTGKTMMACGCLGALSATNSGESM